MHPFVGKCLVLSGGTSRSAAQSPRAIPRRDVTYITSRTIGIDGGLTMS